MKDAREAKAYFDNYFVKDAARAGVWREIARFVQRDIADPSSLLELGCGYGDFIQEISVARKIAMDLNENSRQGIPQEIRFVQGDCVDLSFLNDGEVANVFASNLLEHIERSRLDRVMAEISRVLKNNGRMIIIQPNYRLCSARYFDDYTHVTIFSDISMRGFLESNGFRTVRSIPGLLPFSMKSKIPRHPLLVRFYLAAWIRPFARQMYVVAEKE